MDQPAHLDPFESLGLEPSFRVAEAELRRAWLRKAAATHPDVAGESQSSAAVNAAYQTLRDPLLRGEALLRRLGSATAPEPPLDPAFLASMIELRERLDDASSSVGASGSVEPMRALRAEASEQLADVLEEVARRFDLALAGAVAGSPIDAAHAQPIRSLLVVARTLRRVLENVDAAIESAVGPAGRS